MSDDSLLTAAERRPVLDYPFGAAPAPGETREVAPGVFWLRMPLPFALTHINLYAVRDQGPGGPGWAAVDCGVDNAETLAAWQKHLGPGGVLADGGISRVFITHMHPDHVGMAGWLVNAPGVPRAAAGGVAGAAVGDASGEATLWMTREEYLTCRVLVADTGRAAPEDALRFYRRAGWDEGSIASYRRRFGGFGKFVHALPESYRRLLDGERLQIGAHSWRVVVGNGHSPEHACFHCEEQRLFISGDQVLPRISSNVSVFPTEPEADPLGDWLDSLAKLKREVPDDVLVLPAHNEPFRGLHARLDYLALSQSQALERLQARLAQPCRAVDVFEALFSRPIGTEPNLLGMATGESIAHLNYLLQRGQAVCEPDAARRGLVPARLIGFNRRGQGSSFGAPFDAGSGLNPVIPAQAGIHGASALDPRLRGDD